VELIGLVPQEAQEEMVTGLDTGNSSVDRLEKGGDD
jgi:hypothetical protein